MGGLTTVHADVARPEATATAGDKKATARSFFLDHRRYAHP
jgi:hypothetical protein